MSAYKGPYNARYNANAPTPKPEWKRLSKWHPRRWLWGFTWYRSILAPAQLGGGIDFKEYRTDRQMAAEMLAQLKPYEVQGTIGPVDARGFAHE